MRISRGGFDVRRHAIVQVHTDEGLIGLGEGVGQAAVIRAILEADLAARAVGLDPTDIEGIRQRLMEPYVYFERKGSAICAFSAIEMACWDIKGKALGAPVHRLLAAEDSAPARDRIEAYASDVYWEEDPARMADRAEQIVRRGFGAVKAHIGCRPPEEETIRVRSLREAVGVGVKLMIDLNAGYSAQDAIRAAQLWEPFDIYWLEEPVRPDPAEALVEVRRGTRMALAAGENEFCVHGFKQLFDLRAVDVAMPDIGRAGGILETKKICGLAEEYGVRVSPHNFSSGILLAATLHLMAATPNTSWLEFDCSENAVYHELLEEPLKMERGFVRVPTRPGLGVHLPADVLRKFAHAAA